MIATVSGIEVSVIPVHPLNRLLTIFVTPSSKWIVFRLEQSLKGELALVKPAGIVISVRAVQLPNALVPSVFKLFDSLTDASFVQP